MRTQLILVFFSLLIASSALAQTFSGTVICQATREPIAYTNIGIMGKGIGTVSGPDGRYSLELDPIYDRDTLMISSIGYHPFKITAGDFRKLEQHHVSLDKRIIELAEVVVRPVSYRKRTLGNTTRSRSVKAGFKENQLGYEMGVLMKIRRPSFIEKVNINIATSSYDTLFYRLNIYKVEDVGEYVNILTSPVYLELPADKLTETIAVDLSHYNIRVSHDFLVTLEHVRDLGPGHLHFSAGLRGRTQYRKTSQATWESVPVGVGISVDVLEEK